MGLTLLQRGWLSSNNLLLPAAPGESGATLIDTGHHKHAQQTVALVRHALVGKPLALIVNTHLHSDHCGGNAALQEAFGSALWIPPGQATDVQAWNEPALSHHATGQVLERFVPQDILHPNTQLRAGSLCFDVLAAPGHDPHSLILFEPQRGLLVSADALWENGFGVVFPELVGEPGFADVASVLDLIDRLPVQLIVPGHGAPFTDVKSALSRARSRLAAFQREPARHRRHAAKVLLKYHLMEVDRMALPALQQWACQAPLMHAVWQAENATTGRSAETWVQDLVHELAAAGALALQPTTDQLWVLDRA